MEILTWQARNKKNMTLEDVSALTGMSIATINNIENGKTVPTILQLEAIAKALDTKITALFESEYK